MRKIKYTVLVIIIDPTCVQSKMSHCIFNIDYLIALISERSQMVNENASTYRSISSNCRASPSSSSSIGWVPVLVRLGWWIFRLRARMVADDRERHLDSPCGGIPVELSCIELISIIWRILCVFNWATTTTQFFFFFFF